MDGVISRSPKVRFVVEIVLVLFLINTTGYQINNFHGLWGVDQIFNYLSPLTPFACVGIINAINLIDGVDGYPSGYSIVAAYYLFGVMYYELGNNQMAVLAAIVGGSLLPFFLHNVFGKYSKMFIGDAGTLSLGIIFSVFVSAILSTSSTQCNVESNLGLVPFTLAVLCVPVFDTLRVMSARVLRSKSPFSLEKTHLHHLFIELDYSHIGMTLSIIGINLFVVLCRFMAYKCGASIDTQLYIVLALGIFVTFIFYPFIKKHIKKETALYHILNKIGS